MTDLEWLAGHLGWTDMKWIKPSLFKGIPPTTDKKLLRDMNFRLAFPRYDKSIDLMVELVEGLPLDRQHLFEHYLIEEFLAGQTMLRLINAPAHLRLKAYRMVMES
jgi:hypothetical protein